jgi:hypothetical protein
VDVYVVAVETDEVELTPVRSDERSEYFAADARDALFHALVLIHRLSG